MVKLLTDTAETHLDTPTYFDLTASLQPRLDNEEGVYKDALQILISLQASPSCNRIATSILLESCRSMDGSEQGAENELDDLRTVYAAQLAMCEITSAGAAIPQSCKALAPSMKAKPFNHRIVKGSIKQSIGQCLQALESRPQWWTSYSNSRQNAIVICKAARIDTDKGNDVMKVLCLVY